MWYGIHNCGMRIISNATFVGRTGGRTYPVKLLYNALEAFMNSRENFRINGWLVTVTNKQQMFLIVNRIKGFKLLSKYVNSNSSNSIYTYLYTIKDAEEDLELDDVSKNKLASWSDATETQKERAEFNKINI